MWEALFHTIAETCNMSENDKAVLFDQLNSASVEMCDELITIYIEGQF